MTNKQWNKNPIRPIIKVKPYQKLDIDEGESTNQKHDTDEGESTTSTELSEDSISSTPTGSTEDSKVIETPQVPTVFIKSTHDESDSSITKPMTEF